ncbi:MAG: hypothetical protein IKL48_05425 [Elusimicrobiaceae bacterium]|nr:hypothetical protein [Elusimicrobiaceae bacterium]
MLKKSLLLAVCLLFPFGIFAQESDILSPETLLLDVPTANVLDKYQASLLTRSYANGTIMESLDFGVIPQVNIGVSLAVYELVGSSDDIKVLDPDFQVKWKVFDGSLYLPAVAIGYDGRRYGYNKKTKDYLDDRKGGYITLTRELFTPGLNFSLGANLSDFDRHDIYAFTGMSWNLKEYFSFLAEWDNINNIRDSRFNIGANIFISPALTLTGAVRRIGRGSDNERILQLRYVTNF